jgi:hypothetical protein
MVDISSSRRHSRHLAGQSAIMATVQLQSMDYSILRTGLFGLSYVGHVKFFPGESESKFKIIYCFA